MGKRGHLVWGRERTAVAQGAEQACCYQRVNGLIPLDCMLKWASY